MGLTYGDLFTEWEIAIAKKAVSHFQTSYPWLKGLEFEDLLQECLTHWCLNRDKFQKDKGISVKTFMDKVLTNRLQEILREQMTDRRKAFYLAESLEKLQAKNETTQLEKKPIYENLSDLGLRLDMEFVLKTLTPRQRKICILLGQDYPVTRIAEMLGRPRSTVRDEIKRIREVFSRKDFESYLK